LSVLREGGAYVKLQAFWLAFFLSRRAPIFKLDICLLSERELMPQEEFGAIDFSELEEFKAIDLTSSCYP